MADCYMGNILHVDLTQGICKAIPLDPKLVELYVGERFWCKDPL